jgi:SagB-type dehydrogenase family enzyme
MKTDRRGFVRLLGGALAGLLGRSSLAVAQQRAFEIHDSTRNTRLGALGVRLRSGRDPFSPFKPYPGARRLELPSAETSPALSLAEAARRYAPAVGFEKQPLSLAELARVLYFANGVTGQVGSGSRVIHLRAAPSAGALYAGEVYLVAERVSGLAPGLYYYAVVDHQLVELRLGSLMQEVTRALERPGAFERAPAAVLLSNVFPRYSQRYLNRGYRFALIDSGHIGENLRLAASSAGLGEAGPLRFCDDALNALIEVDGREEAVCAVHALGRPADSADAELREVRRFVERQHAIPGAVPKRGLVPELYHEATKLVPAPPATPAASQAAPQEARAVAPGSGLALEGRRSSASATVEQAIRGRRSAERFRTQPLALSDLGFVLRMAQGHAALQRSPGVDLYLAVHRVEGLDPGLYRYQPEADRLALLHRGDLSSAMASACLRQEKARTAAAGFVMVGRLADSASRAGDRGYRDLLLESGGIGQRVYLAAEATGLVARNLAAFLDDEFNQLLGLDGRSEAAIHLTMLGHGS